MSAANALTPPSAAEIELLPPEPAERGYRLACLCDVRGDLTLSVPPESQALRNAPRKPYTVTDVLPRPIVARVRAEVPGAYAEPLRPLAERVRAAVAGALGRKSVELPAAVMAAYSTAPGFDAAREVTATVYAGRTVLALTPGRAGASYGVAIDVGTTSIVAFLCDLDHGRIVGMRTAGNPQAIYGEDVISRMTHIQQDVGTLADMRRLLVDEVNRLIDEAAADAGVALADIVDAVVVGNPTMQHILLGINPEPLGRGPYLPVWAEGVEVEAAELALARAAARAGVRVPVDRRLHRRRHARRAADARAGVLPRHAAADRRRHQRRGRARAPRRARRHVLRHRPGVRGRAHPLRHARGRRRDRAGVGRRQGQDPLRGDQGRRRQPRLASGRACAARA